MASGALTGKTAFVTGASSGIGEASARLLAEDGAAVLMMGRGEDALAAARSRIVDACRSAAINVQAVLDGEVLQIAQPGIDAA